MTKSYGFPYSRAEKKLQFRDVKHFDCLGWSQLGLYFCTMPWYKISYTSSKGRLVSGFKEFHIRNVDDAFIHFQEKAKAADPDHSGFNCVMVSTKSEEWQEWNRSRYKTRYKPAEHRSGPGKYRDRKEG